MDPAGIFTLLLVACFALAMTLDALLGFDTFLTPRHRERDTDES